MKVGSFDVNHKFALVQLNIPEHNIEMRMPWRLAELVAIALLDQASEAKKNDRMHDH